MKRFDRILILCSLLVISCLYGCTKASPQTKPIGILSDNPTGQIMGDVDPLAMEQQAGYTLGLQGDAYIIQFVQAGEGNLQDDVQLSVRTLVEKEQVLAVMGGTSNEATMRAASLVNFFNLPMIIPSASGENLLPSNNLWVFRLSPPSSSYADYIFGTLLLQPVLTASEGEEASSAEQAKIPRLAILYEPNTFGESAAVETATAAMKLSTNIVYYSFYSQGENEADQFRVQAEEIKNSHPNLIYLISNDSQKAITLVSTLKQTLGSGLVPLILGQGGGFTSQVFLASPEADGVYVIRQTLDKTICPVEMDTIYKAQTYAATALIEEAIKQAEANTPKQNPFSTLLNPKADHLAAQREKIRDTLKQIDFTAPCLGRVTFDNGGQLKTVQFEILMIKEGQTFVMNPQNFRTTLEDIVSRDYQAIEE